MYTVEGPIPGNTAWSVVNGWTDAQPIAPFAQGKSVTPTGSRIIYVSSSTGNDGNAGTYSSPLASITTAVGFLRDGFPDQVLLKKGDTWTNDIPGQLAVNGLSFNAPILLGTYGSGPRPVVRVSGSTAASGVISTSGAGGGGTKGNNIAIIGWEISAYTRDPSNVAFSNTDAALSPYGIRFLNNSVNLLIEDCFIHHFIVNIDCELGVGGQTVNGLTIRRNIITDAYSNTGAHSQGMFLDGNINVLIQQNLFDFNGWNTSSSISPKADPTVFNHNVYIQTSNINVTSVENISTNASLTGFQHRPGGTVTNNLLSNNPVGFNFGYSGGKAYNNVILSSSDIAQGPSAQSQGFGIDVILNGSSILIDSNIIANSISSSAGGGLTVDTQSYTGNFTLGQNTITNVSGTHVNSEWPVGCLLTGANIPANTTIVSASGFTGVNGPGTIFMSNNASGNGTASSFTTVPTQVTLNNNYIFNQANSLVDNGNGTVKTNNVVDATGANNLGAPEPFPFPARSISSYAGTLGLTNTLTGFLNAARNQSRDSWNPSLTANAVNTYIRAGFNR
jgi:hypothetical protein